MPQSFSHCYDAYTPKYAEKKPQNVHIPVNNGHLC